MPTAVTRTLTTTPHVARTLAGANWAEIVFHLVDRPPSMRMSASAKVPMTCASSKSSNSMPTTPSPSRIPTPRNTSSAGSPRRWVARMAAMETSTVTQPMSSARYSWGNVTLRSISVPRGVNPHGLAPKRRGRPPRFVSVDAAAPVA